MRAAKYYPPPSIPDDATLLAGLPFVLGSQRAHDLTYLENFSGTTGPFPPLPHPALTAIPPNSAASQFITGALSRLNASNRGAYDAMRIIAWRGSRCNRPLMRLLTKEKLVGFAIIRYARSGQDEERMLQANRRLFEEGRALGGTLYPCNAVNLSRSDWRHHYGLAFTALAHAKRCYDPADTLVSGPDVF
jgi:hypothetical protein